MRIFQQTEAMRQQLKQVGESNQNLLSEARKVSQKALEQAEYSNNDEYKAAMLNISSKALDVGFEILDENNDQISVIAGKIDTLSHIQNVRDNLKQITDNLEIRGVHHDASKLESPEAEIFAIYGPKLKETTYGSDEYKQNLKEMNVALTHHYENNSHHPEHYPNGLDGMSLLDVIEMVADWKAACDRHADGNIYTSLITNKERFKISDQLSSIIYNTIKELYPDVVEPSN